MAYDLLCPLQRDIYDSHGWIRWEFEIKKFVFSKVFSIIWFLNVWKIIFKLFFCLFIGLGKLPFAWVLYPKTRRRVLIIKILMHLYVCLGLQKPLLKLIFWETSIWITIFWMPSSLFDALALTHPVFSMPRIHFSC